MVAAWTIHKNNKIHTPQEALSELARYPRARPAHMPILAPALISFLLRRGERLPWQGTRGRRAPTTTMPSSASCMTEIPRCARSVTRSLCASFFWPAWMPRISFHPSASRHALMQQLVSLGVTAHPTAAWVSQQITEELPWNTAPTYLPRDRDAVYGAGVRKRLQAMGIRDREIAPRSP